MRYLSTVILLVFSLNGITQNMSINDTLTIADNLALLDIDSSDNNNLSMQQVSLFDTKIISTPTSEEVSEVHLPVHSTSDSKSTSCPECITMLSTADAAGYTWANCREKCRNSTEGGFTDWRMPTWDETLLYSSGLLDPPGGWQINWTWTATPWDTRIADKPNPGDWLVFNESNGKWNITPGTSNSHNCRCVR